MDIMSNNDNTIYQIFQKCLQSYREVFTNKTFNTFVWMVIACITVDEIRSIKFVWDNFLSTYLPCTLNTIYYFFAYSPWSIELLIAETIHIILSIVPLHLHELPVFLIIDDTLQAKFGKHFTGYQRFYDNYKRSNNNYLIGNNFVCLVLSVPIEFRKEIRWLSLPVGLWLYTGTTSKLEIAGNLINIAPSVLGDRENTAIK